MISKRRFGLIPLISGWTVYWVGLAAATLSTPARLLWRIARGPTGESTVSAGLNNGVLDASVAQRGEVLWSGDISVIALTLWIAGPPLLMWAVWLYSRTRSIEEDAPIPLVFDPHPPPPELPLPDAQGALTRPSPRSTAGESKSTS